MRALAPHPPHCWPCLLMATAPSAGARQVLWHGAASPVSPVVVHDLVVQVLLVGQVPVGRQVLLVCLLVEVSQLSCRGHRGSGVRGNPWPPSQRKAPLGPAPRGRGTVLAGSRLPLHCSRWETSSAALLSLQGSRPSARSFLIWRVKRYLWRGTGALRQGRAQQKAWRWPEPWGLCHTGGACPRASPCARPCFNPRDVGPRGHRRSTQAPQKDAAGHHCDQYAPAI